MNQSGPSMVSVIYILGNSVRHKNKITLNLNLFTLTAYILPKLKLEQGTSNEDTKHIVLVLKTRLIRDKKPLLDPEHE